LIGFVVAIYLVLPLYVSLLCLILSILGIFYQHTRQWSLMVISFLCGYFLSTLTYSLPTNHISLYFQDKETAIETKYVSTDERWEVDTPISSSGYRAYIHQQIKGMIASDAFLVDQQMYRYRLRLLSMAGVPTTGDGYLYTDKSHLRYGDIIETALNITQSRASNPGQVDYFRQMVQNGIYFTAREYAPIHIIDHQGSLVLKAVYRVKDWVSRRYQQKLKWALPIAMATVLSERWYLERYGDDFYDRLALSGVLHLFAVSGLHISIFTLVLVLLVSVSRFPHQVGKVFVVLLLLLYILILNGSPPIVRAGIVVFLAILVEWWDRVVNRWQILLVSLFIISILYPKSLFSMSLQYTFLAYSGILFSIDLSARLSNRWKAWCFDKAISHIFFTKGLPFIMRYFIVVICIQIMLLPTSIYYFQQINLNAFFANIVCIPLFSLLLPLFFLIIIFPISLFTYVAEALSEVFIFFIKFFSSFPFVYNVYVGVTELIFMQIMIFLGLILLVYGKGLFYKCEGALLCCLSLCLLISKPTDRGFEMVFFDVGNGDACLIQFAPDDVMIVDVAEYDNNSKNISKNMVRYLKDEHIASVQKVLLTHYHSDHFGGIFYLGEHIQIDTLIVNPSFIDSEVASELKANLYFANTVFWVIDDTLTYQNRDYQIKFLHPSSDFYDTNENNNSIVCQLTYQGVTVLFTGDIERRVEERLLIFDGDLLKSDILKAAHHGSGTSSSFEFIQKVNPEVFIISASNNTNRMLTSPTTFETASVFADKVYHTGRDGAVVVRMRE